METKVDYEKAIHEVYRKVLAESDEGQIAKYIPELEKVNPNQFGVHLMTLDNKMFGVGDWSTRFSIQSIAKVLSLSQAYSLLGDGIWERVGVEPSGNAFNSLVQLETDHGIPRNPFLNGGALVVCDMLISSLTDPKEEFLAYVREVSCCGELQYSASIARSERSVGYRNKALCNFIKSFDNIENDPDDVLDFYFNVCSIQLSCFELCQTFMFLANSKLSPSVSLNTSQVKRINAIMQTCGFYDESGEFSFKVGLPGKSGVGGGIVAVYPGKYCIAVWSPRLNRKGNSHRGMRFLELFTTETKLSIF